MNEGRVSNLTIGRNIFAEQRNLGENDATTNYITIITNGRGVGDEGVGDDVLAEDTSKERYFTLVSLSGARAGNHSEIITQRGSFSTVDLKHGVVLVRRSFVENVDYAVLLYVNLVNSTLRRSNVRESWVTTISILRVVITLDSPLVRNDNV